jgi:hypothetical protein
MNAVSSPVNNNGVLCDYCYTSIITGIYSNGQFYCDEDCRNSNNIASKPKALMAPKSPKTRKVHFIDVPQVRYFEGHLPPQAPKVPQAPQVPQVPQVPQAYYSHAPHAPHSPQFPQVPQVPQAYYSHAPHVPQVPQAPQAPQVPKKNINQVIDAASSSSSAEKPKRYGGVCDRCHSVWTCNSRCVDTGDAWYCSNTCKVKHEQKDVAVNMQVNYLLPLPSSNLVTVMPLRVHYRERHRYF